MATLDWLLHQAKLARMKEDAERQAEAEQARRREEARVPAPAAAEYRTIWETEPEAAERLRTERRWPGVRVFDPTQQRERVVYPPFPVKPGLNEERFKEWWAKHLELERKRQREWKLPAEASKASAEPAVPRAARERIGDVPYLGPQLQATTEMLSSPLLLSLFLAPELAPIEFRLLLGSLEQLAWYAMTNPEEAIKEIEAAREKRGQSLPGRKELAKQFTEVLRQEAEEQKKARRKRS